MKIGQDYFLPLLACLAGSETCFLSFRFWSFSRCIFLCCSNPSAFFAFLEISSTLASNRITGTQKPCPLTMELWQYLITEKFRHCWRRIMHAHCRDTLSKMWFIKQLREAIIKNSAAMTVKRFFILLLRHVVLKLRFRKIQSLKREASFSIMFFDLCF